MSDEVALEAGDIQEEVEVKTQPQEKEALNSVSAAPTGYSRRTSRPLASACCGFF